MKTRVSRRFAGLPLSGAALASVALSLPALPALASEDVAMLTPEVVVSATRMETATDKVGSSVTVVTGEEMERRGKVSLIDALSGVPGLSFTRTGGVGATTQIKLRGGDSGQTQVLIDGVQLNDGASTDNSFDFDLLTTSGIERVEVLRGPQSALYGADAMTGVVNIVTKRGRGPLTAQALGEIGSFNSRRGAVAASGDRPLIASSSRLLWGRATGLCC